MASGQGEGLVSEDVRIFFGYGLGIGSFLKGIDRRVILYTAKVRVGGG
jgi:hypothetical protein